MTGELESLYRKHVAAGTAISAHLPRLRELAEGLDTVVEFGVKRGASSTALLLGAKRVVSFDIARTPEALALKAIAGDRWDYRIEDSKSAEVPSCALLFIDSQHDFQQCRAEMETHGDKVSQFIVLHDHVTFGSFGANGETGRHKWTYVLGKSVPLDCLGLRHAVDLFMIARPEWRIAAAYPESHGLLVLRRDA